MTAAPPPPRIRWGDMFVALVAWSLPAAASAAAPTHGALPTVPPGFAISVFAGEPLVYKPTSLCFDEQGRLLVGQGPQYHLSKAVDEPDSVVMLLDTNGDGVADERKIFAIGFNSIQGLAWKGGDLYVANSPELTVVRDHDGDVYYAHPHFPAEYRDVFLINDWMYGTYVYRPAWDGALRRPADGVVRPLIQRSEGGMFYRPTDLDFGPDGSLYSLGWGGNYHYEPGQEGGWVF